MAHAMVGSAHLFRPAEAADMAQLRALCGTKGFACVVASRAPDELPVMQFWRKGFLAARTLEEDPGGRFEYTFPGSEAMLAFLGKLQMERLDGWLLGTETMVVECRSMEEFLADKLADVMRALEVEQDLESLRRFFMKEIHNLELSLFPEGYQQE